MLWLHHRVPSSCFLISVLMRVIAAEFSKSKIYDSLVLRSFGSLWNIWFSTWSVVTLLLLLNGSNVSIGKGVKFSSRYSGCGVKVFMNASAASEIDNSLAKDEAIVSGWIGINTFLLLRSFLLSWVTLCRLSTKAFPTQHTFMIFSSFMNYFDVSLKPNSFTKTSATMCTFMIFSSFMDNFDVFIKSYWSCKTLTTLFTLIFLTFIILFIKSMSCSIM